MDKGNILVIGDSGVGKSTLINAVLGEEIAESGFGDKGTTKELKVYESDVLDFRIIDTVGFEPSFFKRMGAINAVKKWSKNAIKEGKENSDINVIWFCVEGTSSKLFPEAIKSLSKATSIYPSVPIIVVITKSYSKPERERNIQMVKEVFEKQKNTKNLKGIIPVVAMIYEIDEEQFVAQEGITELIDMTYELIPEGMQAAKKDIEVFKLNRKRSFAQTAIATFTLSAVAIAAIPIPLSDVIPIPLSDAVLLTPLESGEINAIAKIYGIKNDKNSKRFIASLVEAGTVGVAAKAAINALKAIPAINLAASVINAAVAGAIVLGIGEVCVYIYEQIYLGNKSLDDVDWLNKVIESKLNKQIIEKINMIVTDENFRNGNITNLKKLFAKLLSK